MGVLGYLLPVLIFVAGFLAINHWVKPAPDNQWDRRKILFIGLAVVVLIWLLSALGVFGYAGPWGVDPLLNR